LSSPKATPTLYIYPTTSYSLEVVERSKQKVSKRKRVPNKHFAERFLSGTQSRTRVTYNFNSAYVRLHLLSIYDVHTSDPPTDYINSTRQRSTDFGKSGRVKQDPDRFNDIVSSLCELNLSASEYSYLLLFPSRSPDMARCRRLGQLARTPAFCSPFGR
jgi:hypothetical protein